jgi:hypothetical protein
MSLLRLFEFTSVSFLSSPVTAEKCRKEVDEMLLYHKTVEIDFINVYTTAGFLEHLITPLLEHRGELVLERIFFANCSELAESSISQVISRYHNLGLQKIS